MDELLGTIKLFAGNFTPANYKDCDGSLLPLAENSVLFTILGTNYGGDGQTNFALPDLRSAAPNNTQYLICATGAFP